MRKTRGSLCALAWALALATPVVALPPRADVPEPPPRLARADPQAEQARRGELGEWASWRSDPSAPGPGDWTLGWRHGFRIGRRDGSTELLLGGGIMFDVGTYYRDPGLRSSGSGWGKKAEARRGRLFVQGLILRKFLFKVAYDVVDEEVKDVYLGVRDVGPILALVLGQTKEPFSLENETSLRNQPLLERSLASALAPGRNLGVMGTGQLAGKRIRWAIGAFLRDDSRRQEEEAVRGYEEDLELAIRITGLPLWEEDGQKMVLVGASFANVFVNEHEQLSLSASPETRLVKPLIGTGTFDGATAVHRVGVEFAAVRGPFWVQADGIANRYSRRDRGDLDFWGGSLRAGWLLTGEYRRYGRASGVFGTVVPRRPFSWRQRRFGALEIAGRISYLDLTDEDVRGGQELNLTLGLNWYLRARLRVGVNWVHAHAHGRGDLDVLQARLQFDL